MKRGNLTLFALFIFAFILSGCSAKTDNTLTDSSVSTSSTVTSTTTPVAPSNTPEQQIQVDRGLLNVKITFPASLFEDSERTPEEIESAAKEQGIKKVTFNDDGSVTYEMSKDTHKKLVDTMKTSIDDSITEMLSDPDGTNSFKSITYNDACSEFSVFVDRSKYNEWASLAALGFYVQGAYYQSLQGVDPEKIKIIVNFIDNDTKEVINTADSSEIAD